MPVNDNSPLAVITGASSGIGAATARALARDGYRLALLARRAERVGNEPGGVDVLVNNAGVMLLGPFASEQHEEQRQMVETNLLGAIAATEVFLDQLREGGGDLVNVSSVAGRTARPGNAVYAATKWGMGGWSESLRQELQPDVRVVVIEPGAVATELTDHITHGETKAAAEQMYEEESISAEDVAEVIAFALARPRGVSLNEILIRPTGQSS
jgi:NADP-dependent 3-hydroxy acid dehydrogenase YdfG